MYRENGIAVIGGDQKGLATVTYHDLDPAGRRQDIPEVGSFTHINFSNCETEEVVEPDVPLRLHKRFRKSSLGMDKIVRLLSLAQRSPTLNPSPSASSESVFPKIEIGNSAFIENVASTDLKESDALDLYVKMALEFRNGFRSEQYLNCRAGNIKAQFLQDLTPGKSSIGSFQIGSGVCLFSRSALGLPQANGAQFPNAAVQGDETCIPRLPYDAEPTLYEMETTARLASTIADVVAIVRRNSSQAMTCIPIQINLTIPDLQYYCSAVELYERNLVDISYLRQWISLIDKRHDQVGQFFRDAIIGCLGARGLDHRTMDIEIKLSTGTEGVLAFLKGCLAAERCPSLDEVLLILQAQGPDARLWKEFLERLDNQHRPDTLRKLSLLAYVFEVLKPALAEIVQGGAKHGKEAPGKGDRAQAIIQIDDILEWRIYEKAEKLLKQYKAAEKSAANTFLVGLFPAQRIFTTGDWGRSDLYKHDPGQQLLQTNSFSDALLRRYVKPLDILTHTYGPRIGGIFERALSQFGQSWEN